MTNISSNRTRADYDELTAAARAWAVEAEKTNQMIASIRQSMEALQGGDWVGTGANAFYAEMNGQVLPSLNRLARSLTRASETTRNISRSVKEAEDAAAAVLNGQGVNASGGSGGGSAPIIEPISGSGGDSSGSTGGAAGAGAGRAAGAVPVTMIPQWQRDNPLLVRDPHELFQDAYMRDLVGSTFQGADSPRLRRAMDTLWKFRHGPNGPEFQQALNEVANLRGLTRKEVETQWQKYQDALNQQEQNAAARKDPVPGLNFTHPYFMGSTTQLRSGKVVGDAFGIDPVFGALLNPTGGLVGPGNAGIDLNGALGYHGVVHDAAGYLYNNHRTGPGYDYLTAMGPGHGEGRNTGDPLSGQREGIKYWRETLGQTDPGATAGEWIMRGMVGGIDGVKKGWRKIKSIF
jgi:WXG100 family type VII secretion target